MSISEVAMKAIQRVAKQIRGQICLTCAVISLLAGSSVSQTDIAANWHQFHYAANGTRLNPRATVLTPETVPELKLKWHFKTGSFIYSSPAVVDGVVYIGSGDHNVYALNASTGKRIWKYRTGAYVLYTSPAVVGGVVYIGSWDDNVYALKADTGGKVASFTTGYFVDSSPAVTDGVVYIGSSDGKLYALNAANLSKIWSFDAAPGEVTDNPAVVEGVVYISSGYNVCGERKHGRRTLGCDDGWNCDFFAHRCGRRGLRGLVRQRVCLGREDGQPAVELHHERLHRPVIRRSGERRGLCGFSRQQRLCAGRGKPARSSGVTPPTELWGLRPPSRMV